MIIGLLGLYVYTKLVYAYEGLRPGDEGYLKAMCKANGIKYTEQQK